jgi:hypothetical protein
VSVVHSPHIYSLLTLVLVLLCRYDEHLTIRETKNRFVHKQMDIHDAGGFSMMGVTTKF